MNLLDIVNRQSVPEPWSEGDNIPWHEEKFSARMLNEHLSQDHDAASRRFEIVDKFVDWVHHSVLSGKPTKILDLGCGPGLYSNRLAQLGHTCVGIDYSPASIAYAKQQAKNQELDCTYLHQDLRIAEYGEGFSLVILIYGEFNVFRSDDARNILQKTHHALAPDGLLLLEPHTFEIVRKFGETPSSWEAISMGLFSDKPHLVLNESIWNAESKTASRRHFIIDAASGDATRYAQTLQAYTDEEYRAFLLECGFDNIKFYSSSCESIPNSQSQEEFFFIVSQKQNTG
jgi:SAM-dependent methyltransferase